MSDNTLLFERAIVDNAAKPYVGVFSAAEYLNYGAKCPLDVYCYQQHENYANASQIVDVVNLACQESHPYGQAIALRIAKVFLGIYYNPLEGDEEIFDNAIRDNPYLSKFLDDSLSQ